MDRTAGLPPAETRPPCHRKAMPPNRFGGNGRLHRIVGLPMTGIGDGTQHRAVVMRLHYVDTFTVTHPPGAADHMRQVDG